MAIIAHHDGGSAIPRCGKPLETLRNADTLVVDKTGTLTEGKPKLVTVEPAVSFDEASLLGIAAGLEAGSEHPRGSDCPGSKG